MVMLRGPVRELCQAANQAHVATVLPDGAPHSVPVWIGVEGERVVFFTGPGSRKARNLGRRAAVQTTGGRLSTPFRTGSVFVLRPEWVFARDATDFTGSPTRLVFGSDAG